MKPLALTLCAAAVFVAATVAGGVTLFVLADYFGAC